MTLFSRRFTQVALCMAFTAMGGVAAANDDAAILRGLAMSERLCTRCHAIGLQGESPFHVAPPFREIVRRYRARSLEEAFAEGIEVGHPAMPVFQFPPDMIGDLIAYLESLEPEQSEETDARHDTH